ncbi:ABC transporter ATP-binding protein [Desulfuromonas sp. DDH964]|uniref:heme ABC exporter ATP-binding protein CcmA n=1 Tax=Desulfuromonas sp. DDH964 TaxID=1823759 RepID=UPI00078E7C9A|nr:heme ABC exporter ATP-binding protein CcmA [Desulfuromonas sp. DDH964]AMV70630.1 ABC transporter ATP-binding protein [Desulfuromonas sp. DDH964]
MAEPFLHVENLRKSYGGLAALKGVSLTLEAGDFLCLFGPNGAGKSTLLKVLATLLSPSAGTVRAAGYDLEEHPEAFRARLGLVSHQSFLYDDLSARENLEFYAALYGVSDPAARAGELLERVDLAHRAHSPVREFSRGMQQRLTIARALVNDPSLLLLDEPYTGLDEHAASRLSRQLRLLHEAQRTIVMVTHNLRRGLELATAVGILAQGQLIFLQRRDQIDPDAFEQLYFRHLEAA